MKIKKEFLAFWLYSVLIASLINTAYAETSEKEIDYASDLIEVIRLISKDGQMHLVPYEFNLGKRELNALYVPDGASVRRLELKNKGIGTRLGQGCFNVSKQEIVFPEISPKEEKIYLHSVLLKTGEHKKTDLKLQNKNETDAKYDCDGLLIWSGSSSKITYQKINENKQLIDNWTVELSDLINDKKLYIFHGFLGAKDIHIVVTYKKDDKARGLISLSKEGRPSRIEPVLKEPVQFLGIMETSYGYLTFQEELVWNKPSVFKLLDSDFKLLGQIKPYSLDFPKVKAMDNKSYLATHMVNNKDGGTSLMVIASDVEGHITQYPVTYKGEKISSYGPAKLGIVSGKLFIVSGGSRLQKTEKGYNIKMFVVYFPIEIGKP